jgi:hypothetical protein
MGYLSGRDRRDYAPIPTPDANPVPAQPIRHEPGVKEACGGHSRARGGHVRGRCGRSAGGPRSELQVSVVENRKDGARTVQFTDRTLGQRAPLPRRGRQRGGERRSDRANDPSLLNRTGRSDSASTSTGFRFQAPATSASGRSCRSRNSRDRPRSGCECHGDDDDGHAPTRST